MKKGKHVTVVWRDAMQYTEESASLLERPIADLFAVQYTEGRLFKKDKDGIMILQNINAPMDKPEEYDKCDFLVIPKPWIIEVQEDDES